MAITITQFFKRITGFTESNQCSIFIYSGMDLEDEDLLFTKNFLS
jgi:hypothetical protein